MRMPRPSSLLGPLIVLLLAACSAGGNVTRPIPTLFVPAAQPPHRLVVVLPGRGDDLDALARRGVTETIRQQWPDADVILTGLTMPFYLQGHAAARLRAEVLAPARRRGYDQVWLIGISLGGLGSLLYEHAYPGEISGLLLVSPYVGDKPIYREIQAAGGLAAWQPGPEQPFGPETFQRELWRDIQEWSAAPDHTPPVWVAYGDKERFRDRIALLAAQLPPDHVFELPGRHNWTLWQSAIRTLLEHASTSAPTSAAARPIPAALRSGGG